MRILDTLQAIEDLIKDKPMAVLVFSTRTCQVCHPLKEKIEKNLQAYAPVYSGEVFIEDLPLAQANYQVYTAPTILFYVEGKEVKRYGRALDLMAFNQTIERYINLLQ